MNATDPKLDIPPADGLFPEQALHRAWSACVGTPWYDKSVWLAAERQLIEATRGGGRSAEAPPPDPDVLAAASAPPPDPDVLAAASAPPPPDPAALGRLRDCPRCHGRVLAWDARCSHWLCLAPGCAYSEPPAAPGSLADRLADLQRSAQMIDARWLTPLIALAEAIEAALAETRAVRDGLGRALAAKSLSAAEWAERARAEAGARDEARREADALRAERDDLRRRIAEDESRQPETTDALAVLRDGAIDDHRAGPTEPMDDLVGPDEDDALAAELAALRAQAEAGRELARAFLEACRWSRAAVPPYRGVVFDGEVVEALRRLAEGFLRPVAGRGEGYTEDEYPSPTPDRNPYPSFGRAGDDPAIPHDPATIAGRAALEIDDLIRGRPASGAYARRIAEWLREMAQDRRASAVLPPWKAMKRAGIAPGSTHVDPVREAVLSLAARLEAAAVGPAGLECLRDFLVRLSKQAQADGSRFRRSNRRDAGPAPGGDDTSS